MSTADHEIQRDERSEQLVTLGRLLHVAGLVPLLVGALVFYFGVRAPLASNKHELIDRATTVSDLLSHSTDIHAQLDETSQQLELQRRRAAEVRERIPDKPNVDQFLRSLSEAASASGLSVQGFSQGATAHNATFSQVDISLECEGQYESICRFVDRLEKIPRVARVLSLDITAQATEDRYPVLLDIRLYFGVHPAARSVKTHSSHARGPNEAAGGSRLGMNHHGATDANLTRTPAEPWAWQGGRHG